MNVLVLGEFWNALTNTKTPSLNGNFQNVKPQVLRVACSVKKYYPTIITMRCCLLTRPFYVSVHSPMGVWSTFPSLVNFNHLTTKIMKKNLVWLIQKIFVGKSSHLTMSLRKARYQKCSKILKFFFTFSSSSWLVAKLR